MYKYDEEQQNQKYNSQTTFNNLSKNSFADVRIQYRDNRLTSVIQCIPIHGAFDPNNYINASQMPDVGINTAARAVKSLPKSSHSDVLRAALVLDSGVPDPNGIVNTQAHHIVETGSLPGQVFLILANIDSDSAANGVLLPTSEGDDTGNASIHAGSHKKEYKRCVNEALRQATRGIDPNTQQQQYQQAVLGALHDIRTVLLTQNVPLNNRVDATWNPHTGQPDTITAIFARNGLI